MFHGDEVPRTHSINDLINKCSKYNFSVRMDKKIINKITDFAILSRYPDSMNEFTEDDAKLALKYSKQILDTVNQAIDL